MQRREFLKGLVSLPLLAAIPAAALFKPRTVQSYIDEWHSEGAITDLAIWDKVLSEDEVTAYHVMKPAHPEQMPASENLQHWYRLGVTAKNSFAPGRWVNYLARTPTETVAAWVRRAA